MKIKITRATDGEAVEATIELANTATLPSITDGWRFNFKRNTKKEGLETYVLVCDQTPQVKEGCVSFKMQGGLAPYMAYVEIAPHNQGSDRRYDAVAGALIAFACRLSFKYGEGDYKGWLAFDVCEESKADEVKLMALYSDKYGALQYPGTTTMVIPPEGGERLIEEYLNLKNDEGE